MKKVNNYNTSRKAVTIVEITIVIAISSIIMGVAMAMMSRNNTQFKKSNDLISIQRLMDNIVERIRSDVRSLKRVTSYDKDHFEFVIVKDLSESTIRYQFEDNTFKRSDGSLESDFHGSKQILSLVFTPKFDEDDDEWQESRTENDLKGKEFQCLNVAMQIAANEYSNKKSEGSTLSIACQFYSTCVESELKISKLRNNSH